jgi:hypothetical protein
MEPALGGPCAHLHAHGWFQPCAIRSGSTGDTQTLRAGLEAEVIARLVGPRAPDGGAVSCPAPDPKIEPGPDDASRRVARTDCTLD